MFDLHLIGKRRLDPFLRVDVLYSLDLPVGAKQLTLLREKLPNYTSLAGAPAPDDTPIVLNGPTDIGGQPTGDILACGIAHEPPLSEAIHTRHLQHNRTFFNLYKDPPKHSERVFPTMHRQWVDRGMCREGRSALWGVTKDPRSNDGRWKLNICDPNCNGAVVGGGRLANRKFLRKADVKV